MSIASNQILHLKKINVYMRNLYQNGVSNGNDTSWPSFNSKSVYQKL